MAASLPLTTVIGQSHPAALEGAPAILMRAAILRSLVLIMVLNRASIKLLYQNIQPKAPQQMFLRFAPLNILFQSLS